MTTLLELPLIGSLFGTVLPFLIVLAIVIFVHEYGHYIVGRWCGIHSEEFSLGFGPELLGWTDRHGTRWKVSAVPLGGYVRFKGDADAASSPDPDAVAELSDEDRRRTLTGAPIWARALTVAAGPFANFILAILVFAAVALTIGAPSNAPVLGPLTASGQASGAGLKEGDRIVSVDGAPVESFSGFVNAMLAEEGVPRDVAIERDGQPQTLQFSFTRPAQIARVTPDGAAARACLKPDDVILAVDDQPVGAFVELQRAIMATEGDEILLRVQRGPELLTVPITPRRVEHVDPLTGGVEQRVMIGVIAKDTLGLEGTRESVGFVDSLGYGVEGLNRIVFGTIGYLAAWVSGQADGSSLGGPIGIAQASGQTAQAGFIAFVAFIGTVSAAIGFINLFPIPMLDGGHLVFYAVEAIRGRPLSDRWLEAGFKVGLAAILLLLVFATYNDVAKLGAVFSASC